MKSFRIYKGILKLPCPWGFSEEPNLIRFECDYDDYKVKNIKMVKICDYSYSNQKVTQKEFKNLYKKSAKELILDYISDPKNIK